MADEPLISCLMVALPAAHRFERLKQAVADYARQTWGRRELLIVLNGGEPATAAAINRFVSGLGRDDIRVIEPGGELTLGALRNISKAEARGELFCQWDDDDLYHPERLARQASALLASDGEGVLLEQVMQFFPLDGSLFCDSFRGTEGRGFPGSILCRCSAPIVYPETGDSARLGEDSAVVSALLERGTLRILSDHAHLYVYTSYGANSWDDEHHRIMPSWHGLSSGLLVRHEARFRAGLAPHALGPGPVVMLGRNGFAFTLIEGPAADG
jgi:glycosyltransferase involved in cell wall biosynthesis